MSNHAAASEATLQALRMRRSVLPRRLVSPGPAADAIEQMLQVALRAPDHGGLRPWRVIELARSERDALAQLFEDEKVRREPLSTALDRVRAREHAINPPVLLASVVSPKGSSSVPQSEQWLAAGAALGNLLNAAHLMGFGASILSGERCADEATGAKWDPAHDLIHIIGLTGYAFGTVVPATSPIKNWADYVAQAKANPGKLTYSTPGIATTNHLTMERISRQYGIQLNHIPYKGSADSLNAVLQAFIDALAGFDMEPNYKSPQEFQQLAVDTMRKEKDILDALGLSQKP